MSATQRMRPVRAASSSHGRRQGAVQRLRRRLRHQFHLLFPRGDISSLLMTWGLLLVTALAVRAAAWTEGLSALAVVSFWAVGFGFLLARSHYSEPLALLISSIYSLVFVVSTTALTFVHDGSLRERTFSLADQVRVWLDQVIAGNQPENDSAVFVLFLSVLFWFLGHNAAWHVFRVDRVWRVILPTGLVLVTNQLYYQGNRSLDGYLVAFVVLALLLLIRSHIEVREFDWYIQRINFAGSIRRAFFRAGGMLAILVVVIAWTAPTGKDDKSLDRLNEWLSGSALEKLADLWNRLFSSLESQGIATADYYGGEKLKLSGAIQLGDQPVMIVEAPVGPRYYWRSTVYDTYDFTTWQWRHVRSVRAYTEAGGLRLNPGPTVPGARQEIQQEFTLLIRSSRLVYTAPQPVWLDLPVEAELDCVNDYGRMCVNENQPADVAVIRARKTLRAGDTYTSTSSISVASAAALRQAGESYPDWVLRLYLQGTASVAPPVRDLAVQIVTQAGAQSPYDKAKAIERWLRTNIQYNESIPVPPPDRDPIYWFLLEEREGYCNYYATAMVLMLRSLGIPSRMAAGFAQGVWDAERGAYLVRERDAHTWVEVYFPGYGWVEFEPTADEAPLEREGDQVPQVVLPTLTPLPSPTPTATFPPTVPPPTEPGGANATPTDAFDQPFLSTTVTPTPTPILTSTPPPAPDVTRVDAGGGTSVFRVLLITLGILLLLLLVLILAAVFAIWYVEYRGLRGLNSIQRAYARLGIYGGWLGLKFAESATPDERRRYLVGEVPDGEQPINAITRAYVQNRYGASHNIEDAQHVVLQAWPAARRAFIRRKLARLLGHD